MPSSIDISARFLQLMAPDVPRLTSYYPTPHPIEPQGSLGSRAAWPSLSKRRNTYVTATYNSDIVDGARQDALKYFYKRTMPPKAPLSLLTLSPRRPSSLSTLLRHASTSTTPTPTATKSQAIDSTTSQTSPQTSKTSPRPPPEPEPEKKKKTMAELDQELQEKLEGISGEGGAAGLELENGQPVAMKRGVKSNMFRVI